LRAAAFQLFGSWEAAILAAGLKVPPRQWKWPKERLLAELVRRKKLGLAIPSSLYMAARHKFGGVKKALASLGDTPPGDDRSEVNQPS
jgi:hypothetical protein